MVSTSRVTGLNYGTYYLPEYLFLPVPVLIPEFCKVLCSFVSSCQSQHCSSVCRIIRHNEMPQKPNVQVLSS